MLEFDHIHEFARGGESTADNVRLLCRAHNQYAAECTYGAEFMEAKRQEAQFARSEVQGGCSLWPSVQPGPSVGSQG